MMHEVTLNISRFVCSTLQDGGLISVAQRQQAGGRDRSALVNSLDALKSKSNQFVDALSTYRATTAIERDSETLHGATEELLQAVDHVKVSCDRVHARTGENNYDAFDRIYGQEKSGSVTSEQTNRVASDTVFEYGALDAYDLDTVFSDALKVHVMIVHRVNAFCASLKQKTVCA